MSALSAYFEPENRARDDGMARAEGGADPEWNAHADAILRSVAASMGLFTTDELWAAGLPQPREARALGPVMMRARRSGLIENTGRRSLIFTEETES